MKRTVFLLAFSLALAAAFAQDQPAPRDGAAGSDEPWKLLILTGGTEGAEQEINELVRQGYVPVGFEVEPNEALSILLVESGDVEVAGWVINQYDDWNQLENQITAGIRAGYTPMDISRFGESLSVLWVESNIEVDGWRIHTAANTIAERNKAVNDFQELGFTVYGLSIHDNLAWFLFIRQTGNARPGSVGSYRKDAAAIQQGMLGANLTGWLPNGIAVSDDRYFVSYVK